MSIGLKNSGGGSPPNIQFKVGDLVAHRRYSYRGVVVSIDLRCEASEEWYQSNETKPEKEQPWYRILVHDSGGMSTYVAQCNLARDRSGQPIDHPRIQLYFSVFKTDHYLVKEEDKAER